MKEWFMRRQPRERAALLAGAAALAALIVYLALWLPVSSELELARGQISGQREAVVWMKQAAQEVKSRKNAGPSAAMQNTGEAMITIVDRTARGSGLRETIKRLKPDGNDSVQLWLEDAPFDSLILWLGELNGKFGIGTASASFDKRDQSGLINARIALERPSS